MKINIYSIGKIKSDEIKILVQKFLELSGKYINIRFIELRDKNPEQKVTLEEINSYFVGYNIVLSERGEEFTTVEFTQKLTSIGFEYSQLNFFVGNAFGFEREVEQKAKLLLSLSKFTLPHELAHVVLLEQLFRCLNLKEGGKYHKE